MKAKEHIPDDAILTIGSSDNDMNYDSNIDVLDAIQMMNLILEDTSSTLSGEEYTLLSQLMELINEDIIQEIVSPIHIPQLPPAPTESISEDTKALEELEREMTLA